MAGRMIKRQYETSPIRLIASVQLIGTDALEGIADVNEATSGGAVAERDARAETATAQLGKWRIEVHEQYAEPRATQKLLDDANIDVEAWLADKTADIMTRTENTWFVTGNGSNKPRGFTAYTTAATADASRSWGTLEHVVSGASGDFGASDPADKLFDLIGAFKDHFLQNARWVTRREVITKLRKIKTGVGDYLWQPGLQTGQPQQVLGFPVTIAQDMPALAADSLSMAFGDFREGYQIVDRQGIRVLRDPYTAKPYVKFYTVKRVGGGVVNFEAIKFLKFGT
jgi:HK97 family phage major capsid protein